MYEPTPDIGYAYGVQTGMIAARDYEEEPPYPCEYCGGIGFTGQNLTVPCRPCGTSGERTAPRPERPAPPVRDSAWTRPLPDDPWFNPAAAGPPPF